MVWSRPRSAIDSSRVTLADRLQATQLAEIKLPCLDVVHGSGWLPGTQADDAP